MITNRLFTCKYLILFVISTFSLTAFSQQKSNYSLLWRISGKELSKPSYLFGTMHLKDRRIFNFSDSVMLSLQSCQRFALEVHPDTLMIKMFATLQNQDSLRSIDKLLGKEDYEKLAKKFKDKNGYDLGKTDPMQLEALMKPDNTKPDDEVSFIDAYLYGIARTMNKDVLGLEDAASQFDQYYGSKEAIKERLIELLDDDAAAAKDEGMEQMVKIYSTGNLDEIFKYINETGGNDSTIIARNKVMASSMIKYMAGGSLFTAVGAAHLPGPDGVIALLRAEGYTVTRVGASFTGVASRYHIDYMKMKWPSYKNESVGYVVDFPGVPLKFKQDGLSTIIYPDLAHEVFYGVYTLPRGIPGAPANRAKVIAAFVKNVADSKKNKLLGRKDFIFNGTPCTELTLKAGPTYMRLRLILANNTLYAFYAGATLNKLNQPHINRYLNSFVIIPVVLRAPESWITYSNPTGAFTVKLPGQPQPVTTNVPSKISGKDVTFVINMFVSTDTINSKTYLVRYNDYPAGTFLSNPEAVFELLKKEFEGKGKVLSGPDKVLVDGVEARELTLILKGGFHSKIRVFARGNRMYMLFKEVIQPDMKDDLKDVFFDSFKLTPYVEPEYYTFRPDSANYELQMVAKPILNIDSSAAKNYTNYLKNIKTWYSTNPNSGGLTGFEHSTISPYFRAANVDSLYQKMVGGLTDYRDSLVKVDTILLDGIKGREVLTQTKGADVKRRTRILIKGDDVFYLVGRMDNSDLYSKATENFYGSLKIKQTNSKINLGASKAELIVHDLSSPDSTTFKNASGAILYYNFTADELPYIYTALQKSYPDDTLQTGARQRLLRKLRVLHNDSTTNVLVKLYHDLKNNDELRGSVLNLIPAVDKKNGYNIYLDLLTSDAPAKAKNGYTIFAPLNDSLSLAARNFGRIIPLIKNKDYRGDILRIAQTMAATDSSSYKKVLNDNYGNLVSFAQADIDSYVARDSTDYSWGTFMYYYMDLLGKIKNEPLNNKLTKYYLDKDPHGIYAPHAVNARVSNNLPVSPALINKFLDSLGTRYDLMEAFNNQNQLARVPLKYRQPIEFARLCLYQSISTSDDSGTPEKIILLGSIIKNGSVYYAFKFLLAGDDEKKEYIALTGPYKQGMTKLDFKRYNTYSGYDALETNWRAQATKMIKPLIEKYKE